MHINTWSFVRDKNPEGDIQLSIMELIEYTIALSDNNDCNILLELLLLIKQTH